MTFTRRAFGRACGAWFFSRRFLRAAERVPLSWISHTDAGGEFQRRYRADAQILLLSIPVLHRTGVGDGAAAWRDSIASDGAAERFLEFVGRSAPEHAAGLNRFGFIQELSRTSEQERESLYFGLMTSSPEESATDARKVLYTESTDASFSAIEGRIAAGCIETVSAHFIAPARTSSADQMQLIERARVALSSAAKKRQQPSSSDGLPGTFLHVLAGLLIGHGRDLTRYAFNGSVYHLRVGRSPDAKATATYREMRLIPPAATVTRISGTLWRKEGGKPSEFRLWIEEGCPRPLPLRIEYQPKPYLRLTFEAEA
jgi:hypothetical protein